MLQVISVGVLAMSWCWFGPNSISVTRQLNLMASDVLVVTDFLAWRLHSKRASGRYQPTACLFQCLRLVSIHASIGHERRLDLMVQRNITVA